MRAITIELTDEAYEVLKKALEEHQLTSVHTVRSWLEEVLNDNTEVIVDKLLFDF